MYICQVIKKYIILCIVIVVQFNTTAQAPSFFRIGGESFSNINVFSVIYEDEKDILYAATNRGLFAYKQNKFTIIKSSENSVTNGLFQLQRNHKGELFCCSLSGQVFSIKNDKLSLFYQMPIGSKVHSFSYYFDRHDNLIVNSLNEIRKINSQGEESILLNQSVYNEFFNMDYNLPLLYSKQLTNGKIYFLCSKKNEYFTYHDGVLEKKSLPKNEINSGRNFFQLGDVTYYNSDNTFKRLDGKDFKTNIQISSTAHIVQIDRFRIAIRSPLNGYRIVSLKDGVIHEMSLGIENSFISAISMNKTGTVFLGTFKDGVFVIPNFDLRKFKVDYPFNGITTSPNNTVYLSNRKGHIYKHVDSLELFGSYSFNINNLAFLKHDYFYKGHKINNIIYHEKKHNLKSHIFDNLKDVVEVEDKFVILMSAKTISLLQNDSIKNPFKGFFRDSSNGIYKRLLKGRGKSVTYIAEDKCIYYSSNLGMFQLKEKEGEAREVKYNGTTVLGNDLINYKGQLVVASMNNGILFYENNNFKHQLEITQGLKSNSVIKLGIHNDLLFILSIKGLQIYDLALKEFIYIGGNEGVFSERVINFAISNDKIWLLDKEGYYSYDVAQIKKNKDVKFGEIYLDSVKVNDNIIDTSKTTEFSFKDNKFDFFFDYRNIETKSETKLEYKLLGVSDKWVSISSTVNKVEFSSLSPGKYNFIVQAVYRGQVSKPIHYKFEIFPPFWFQFWFVSLMIISIVLLVSFLFVFQMKKRENKRNIESNLQKMQTAIFESKLEAIRSQMNPHFIFNSLNSIQALVLKKDIEKSYDYIEMFSDLVRKTLSFSEKSYIDINEEINFLNIYLDLESLRMKNEFSFRILNHCEKEILIPSLLMQPFLENAIHHGLLHKQGQKELLISFDYVNDIGSCIIEDNGIGRKKADEIKARQKFRHQSFSLSAMKKRLEILSEQNNQFFDYVIEDLYTEDGMASGTKVTINFPFKYHY